MFLSFYKKMFYLLHNTRILLIKQQIKKLKERLVSFTFKKNVKRLTPIIYYTRTYLRIKPK